VEKVYIFLSFQLEDGNFFGGPEQERAQKKELIKVKNVENYLINQFEHSIQKICDELNYSMLILASCEEEILMLSDRSRHGDVGLASCGTT